MSSKKKKKEKEKKGKKSTKGKKKPITRATTLTFATRSKGKSSDKQSPKQLNAEHKRLQKERKKLESEKKQLKIAQNKLQNESARFRVQTQKKNTKNSNITKRMQHEIDGYKSEIHSLKKYKQQIISLKKRQQKKKSQKKNSKNKPVQYVWTENIKQIKILNQGASILFDDGSDERIFPHIKIILPRKVKENTTVIHYMFNELQERIEDVKHIQNIIQYTDQNAVQQYVNDVVLKRHTANVPKFKKNLDRLMTNNKLWRYSLLKKEEIKDSIFSVWMQAQNDIKSGKQPSICKEHGIMLQNIYKEKKLNVVHELDRAFHARRFQHHINTKTQALLFLEDHHGQYEYDEDEDLSFDEDSKQPHQLKLNMKPVSSDVNDVQTPSHSLTVSASYTSDMEEKHNRNDEASEYIDTLQIHEEQKALWIHIAVFLDAILPNKHIANDNVKVMIRNLMDGVIFSEMIAMLKSEFIDLRLIQRTSTKEHIIGNISLVIHSIYALNLLETLPINPMHIKQRYFDPRYTVSMMLHIAEYLINAWLDKQINIASYPELIRLCQNDEERKQCRYWSHKIWLKRWLLFIKHPKLKHKRNKSGITRARKKSLKHSIDLREHLAPKDMKDIAHTRANGNHQSELVKVGENTTLNMDINIIGDYQEDIDIVRATLQLEIAESNEQYKHSCYLQEWILSKMFKIRNNIEALSENEKQSIAKQIHNTNEDGETQMMIGWINWMNALNDFRWKRVTNLENDLSDGLVILHLLNLCKAQCVDFEDNKKVKRNIRNKFDKMTNCKEILSICEQQFKFKLVGINETVIVDGNKKYIKSLLSQIKAYRSTHCMSQYLQLNTEDENDVTVLHAALLRWLNVTFTQNDHSEITSLDQMDSVYCLKLISSMNLEHKYVHGSVVNTQNDNKEKNAIYLMNVLRTLGCNIFANPTDIVSQKHHVMMSIISCIMDASQR